MENYTGVKCKKCEKIMTKKSQQKTMKNEEVLKVMNGGRPSNNQLYPGDLVCARCFLMGYKDYKAKYGVSATGITAPPKSASAPKRAKAKN